MATYCFKCRTCEARWDSRSPEALGHLCPSTPDVVRDYQAEAVGIGQGVRVSRTGTVSDMARLVLPNNGDFAGPGDPDGTKGMREWHDTHQPKTQAASRTQVPGRISKRSF